MDPPSSTILKDKNDDVNITTVDSMEVEKFNVTNYWWARRKPLLLTLNEVRVPFMIQSLINVGKLDTTANSSDKPLKGLKILDVGCGGGYLSEALATLGADTTGIDVGENIIKIAEKHKETLDPSIKLKYMVTPIEEYALEKKNYFDVVFSSEVIEHVSNPQVFVNKCAECVKPGGSLVITTINRTIWSKMYMLWFSEYISGIIRMGTHEYEKFITPDELRKMMKDNNCRPKDIQGFTYNPMTRNWFTLPTTKLSYAIHAIKPLN